MKYFIFQLFCFTFIFSSVLYANKAVYTYSNQFDINLLRSIEQVSKNQTPPPADTSPTVNLYSIHINYSDPQKLKETIRLLYPSVTIAVDERTRSLVVSCAQNQIRSIESIIQKLDTVLPQIKIEVQIIEVSYTDFDQYRHIFSSLTDGFQVNYNFKENKITGSDLSGTLTSLIKNGQAKVLAKPTVTTLDNNRSVIKVGDQVPYITNIITENQTKTYQVNYLNAGIELEILPKISSGNSVLTDITASISSIKTWKDYKEASYPILSSRKTQTLVNIENKKTLVIAGLITQEKRDNSSKIPFLSDLWFVGDLFKSKSDETISSDVLFLITPEIL